LESQALIVATLTEAPSAERLAELSTQADVLELRADCVKGLDVEWLRQHFAGRLLYTLRSREEGGRSEASGDRRHQKIIEESQHFDLVDLEMKRDLTSGLLAAIEPARRIISWHGPATSLASLQSLFDQMASEEAKYYKIVPGADQPRQEMAPLALQHSLRRRDLIAFAAGPIGAWTRLIAPRLGAPVVYGAASAVPGALGQPTIERLRGDYGLPDLGPVERLFGLVGAGVEHSLSPRLHNSFYRDLGLPCLYLPFHVEAFGEFWLEVVESGAFEELGFELKGLSVTSPYKRIAAAVGGASSPLVEWLGSANTLVLRDGVWEAESTDGEGVVLPLQELVDPVEGLPAAVLGAGGAGRAAAAALRVQGAEVTLVNRDEERGRRAARELRLPSGSWRLWPSTSSRCRYARNSTNGSQAEDDWRWSPVGRCR
jgi:3-dehydroquinate dehydratase/shikimate dehydrogenase